MIWFTSDTHFGHKKVIEYCQRPFKDVDEMNASLIARWNQQVSKEDTVYFLGDFAFCSEDKAISILHTLNGEKHLIAGNHDKKLLKSPKFFQEWSSVERLSEIHIPDQEAHKGRQAITLCHFAMKVWNKSHHRTWQLYGHSHGSMPEDMHSLQMDVGVDAIYKRFGEYRPISYPEIKAILSLRKFKPIDHHGEKDD